jgi:sugar lactone lactonase YvrE
MLPRRGRSAYTFESNTVRGEVSADPVATGTHMRTEAELVVDCRNDLGEMPLWRAASQTLFWIDVTTPGRLFSWQTSDGTVDFHQFDDILTGLIRRADGGLVVADRTTVFEFEPSTARAGRTLLKLPADQSGHRFNDGACDRAGRLWIGSMPDNLASAATAPMGEQPASTGRIYCLSEAGSVRSFEAGFICPNAMCWSLDDSTLYVADSGTGWMHAYEFDVRAGTIGTRRDFCRLDGLGIPDGAAVDAEGYIWNARWGAGKVARISPTGELDRVVAVAASNPTACCFGGRNLDVLYVTSARYGLDHAHLAEQPVAGGVFAIATDVPGIDKPPYGQAL